MKVYDISPGNVRLEVDLKVGGPYKLMYAGGTTIAIAYPTSSST